MSKDAPALDRRQRRRQQTIDEILDVAVELMAAEGVAGLSLSEVARRMGIRPPSLYKYFPSKLAVYDALFERASNGALAAFRTAAAAEPAGLRALAAGLEASTRLALEHPVLAQLITWRPVPGFEPSERAYAPSREFLAAIRDQVRAAIRNGDLGRGAATDDGLALLSVLVSGVISQQLANEPSAAFEKGRFTRLLGRVLALFTEAYRPRTKEPT
ncbi:TetR/AcrR family transcriptional regulator [Microlunatus parietis]|uniref:AcrR family transcriptional regulator n=1 Tax=Microlunatus parietis TaxID=682979 RepID=A0A7Y9I8J1_9ACTN|nr:TetR/AcrR family transcriptional regulator [Microlunatus parietis]NYE71978.1 AcrR family transcriptional regulator [Microlunatus parietis]